MNISCIIPAYNERNNLGAVLDVVTNFPDFKEIIVVDDGSVDGTPELVQAYQQKCPRLKLLINPQNLGKTTTILNGLNSAQGELIVMIDSDLINLQQKNLSNLIQAVTEQKYDLAILDRAGDRKALWGGTDCARFFGGERALWKKDFQQIKFPAAGGYLLEIVMNKYFIQNHRKIKTIYCENLYTYHHYNKCGFKEGFQHYFQMSSKIVREATLIGFLKQIYHIEEDRLAKLYLWQQKKLLRPFTLFLIPLGGLTWGFGTYFKLNLTEIPIRKELLRIRKTVTDFSQKTAEKTAILRKNTHEYLEKKKDYLKQISIPTLFEKK